MRTAVGIFASRTSAEQPLERLVGVGFAPERIVLLAPGDAERKVAEMPTADGESPGMGKTVGTVVGGAVGAAAGMPLGAMVSSAVLPGVGPVIALGLAAAAIVGAAGAAVGGALETGLTEGVPKDEAFVYADALRQGRSVVIVLADNEAQADAARTVLMQAGAESLDAARDRWWLGLRSAERERYVAEGWNFDRDEPIFRLGFEAAQRLPGPGRPYGERQAELRQQYPALYDREEFRHGYDRGVEYRREISGRRRRDAAA